MYPIKCTNRLIVCISQPSVPVPDQPSITVTSTTATSISLSWNSAGSEVTSSEVMWREVRGGGSTTTAEDDEGSGTTGSITSTSYTIRNLKSSTNYSITVTVANVTGSTVSNSITTSTRSAICNVLPYAPVLH